MAYCTLPGEAVSAHEGEVALSAASSAKASLAKLRFTGAAAAGG